jgi:hypothetical protein
MLGAALAAALALSAGTANARWVKAETDRFIIYGDVPEATARDYAVKLSTFDKVLHTYVPQAADVAPARKFEVYLVSQAGLNRVWPGSSGAIGGFYTTTSQVEFAAVSISAPVMSGDTVLFHEYAHHFMFANFPAAYPTWFTEGWAEYFGNTQITPDLIKVGAYNKDRVWWLGSDWIRWGELFDKAPGDIDSWGALYYPQSWLFIHYMLGDKARAEQLNRITAAIATGEVPSKAIQRIMGLSLAQLNRDLHAYRELRLLVIKNAVPPPQVTVTVLPPSADDLLLERLRLARAEIGKPDRFGFLSTIRRRAAKFPGDALADQVLALAEFTYGDVAAGEAIVARRLAASPDEVETLRIAGMGQVIAAERNPKSREARYRAARPFLIRAYGLDPTDFRTLYAYAFSRRLEPGFPNVNDLKALEEAHGLAPSAADITLLAGDALLRGGQPARGRGLLAILANDPHGGRLTQRAKALLAGGQPLNLDKLKLVDYEGPDDPKPPEPKPKPEPPSAEPPAG